MLVLSRRINEKLLIPCIETAVQVLSIQGGQVRLGVEAPPEVAVFREEIYKRDSDRDESVPESQAPGLLRNRLGLLALGLDRLQRQMQGKLTPGVQAALERLGDEFGELARIVNGLLEDEDDAPKGKSPVGCAR
jgi:carbon storage regulator